MVQKIKSSVIAVIICNAALYAPTEAHPSSADTGSRHSEILSIAEVDPNDPTKDIQEFNEAFNSLDTGVVGKKEEEGQVEQGQSEKMEGDFVVVEGNNKTQGVLDRELFELMKKNEENFESLINAASFCASIHFGAIALGTLAGLAGSSSSK